MAAKTAQAVKAFQPDSDVHISFEDQQKINKFAKHNARLDEFKQELEIKKNTLKNLEEATDEIELFDENEKIPFFMGEVFICHKLEKTQELLKNEKTKKLQEIKEIETKCSAIQEVMNELKTQLYQRFGSNISLESND